MPRAAWKGPFFVAFPGLKQAVQSGTPIATQGLFIILVSQHGNLIFYFE
jgi:hypothetical protein